jgi:hypothetical protein
MPPITSRVSFDGLVANLASRNTRPGGMRFRNIEVEFLADDPQSSILVIGAHYDVCM